MADLNPKKLKEVTENLGEINELASQASTAFTSIGKVISNIARGTGDVKDAIEGAAKANNDLVKSANILASFSKDDLKSKKEMRAIEAKQHDLQKRRVKLESKLKELATLRLNATRKEKNDIDKTTEALNDSLSYVKDLESGFQDLVGANEELNNKTKWIDKFGETLQSIPGIGPLISGPFKDASKAMRESALANEGFWKTSLKGAVSLADAFGPAAILGLLFAADDHIVNIQRGLSMSREESSRLAKHMDDVAISSGKSLLTQSNQLEAIQAFADETGVVRGLSDDQVENQLTLTKRMGLSNQAAAKFSKYMSSTGKSGKEVRKEISDATGKLFKETGIAFKLSAIFEEVANTTAGLKASYGFNNILLAEAVVQTKKLGINLKQAEGMSRGLLDFETSMAKELEAELLTGKQLNFEEARRLAMMGKSAEAAEIILDQVGSTEELMGMGVLQQESLAAAAGLTRDELLASVKERETLEKLGYASIEAARAEGMSREDIAKAMGDEALAAYDTAKASEDFAALLEKIKTKIGLILSEDAGLGKVLRWLAGILQESWAIYSIMGIIGAVVITGWVKKIGGAVIGIVKFFGKLFAGKASEISLEGTITAEKLAQNTATTIGIELQTAKIAELQAQLALEQGILAEKVAQNTTSRTGDVIEKGKLATKKLENVQEQKGLGLALRRVAISAKNLMKSIGRAAMAALEAFAALGPPGWIIGGIASAAAIALGMRYMSDGVISPKGGMVVSGEKGSIQLDKQDSIIAGTNLGGKGGGENKQDNRKMLSLLKQIAEKSTTIEMGGNEVGQGINKAEREVQ